MIKDEKGNPTRIHSLGKFEEPNARFGFSLQMKSKEGEVFDKKQMALAIRNSTYDDSLGCSLLAEGIIKSCEICNLNCVCELIDEVVEIYKEESINVVSSFNFD